MNKIINILMFLATLLANAIIGVRTNDSTELDISPINTTFSIWGLIYSSLFISLLRTKNWNNYQSGLFSISCLSNILWLYFWSKKNIEIANIFLFTLPLSLVLLWFSLLKKNDLFLLNSLGLYAGWTIGAFLLNTFISLNKNKLINKNNINNIAIVLFSLSQIAWQIFGLLSKNKNFYKNSITIPIVGIWTALGIYRNNKIKNLSIFYLISCSISLINHIIQI